MASTGIARWCIETDDRIGMVRDVVSEMASLGVNVEAMEVVAGRIFVRVQKTVGGLGNLRQVLESTPGVKRIDPVDQLPFEADEHILIRRVMQQEGRSSALSFDNLVFSSAKMQEVVRLAKLAAAADVPVMITGESGTGKELLARAIHQASNRHTARLLPLNCAAIPDALIESELFGYVEGAFTGAIRNGRPGLFEVANGGTLFLDEIGELPRSLQPKLLRVIAEGEVRRVGSTTPIHVDVRIIAATNRNLSGLVQTNQFREDLFYRLDVFPLVLPPLRERQEDILPLAQRVLERFSEKLGRSFGLSQGAKERLQSYRFPGNIRELQNILERAVYLSEGNTLDVDSIWLPTSDNTLTGPQGDGGSVYTSTPRQPEFAPCRPGMMLRDCVNRYERSLIQAAIEQHGSLRKAAIALGVSHTTLHNKLQP